MARPELRDPKGARDRPWRGMEWMLLLGIALLIFELTADPALGVVVAGLKFGWDDLHTAGWLRRSDPVRTRGRACSWFLVSWSFLRIGALSLLCLIIMIAASLTLKLAGNPRWGVVGAQLLGAASLTLFGFLASLLTAYVAIGCALWHGTRVWLDPEVNLARKVRGWPPCCPSRWHPSRPYNNALTVIQFVATITLLAALALAIAALVAFVLSLDDRILMITVASIGGLIIVGGAIRLLRACDQVERRLAARAPWECWPEAWDTAAGTPRC
jgi:hypothetical protein